MLAEREPGAAAARDHRWHRPSAGRSRACRRYGTGRRAGAGSQAGGFRRQCSRASRARGGHRGPRPGMPAVGGQQHQRRRGRLAGLRANRDDGLAGRGDPGQRRRGSGRLACEVCVRGRGRRIRGDQRELWSRPARPGRSCRRGRCRWRRWSRRGGPRRRWRRPRAACPGALCPAPRLCPPDRNRSFEPPSYLQWRRSRQRRPRPDSPRRRRRGLRWQHPRWRDAPGFSQRHPRCRPPRRHPRGRPVRSPRRCRPRQGCCPPRPRRHRPGLRHGHFRRGPLGPRPAPLRVRQPCRGPYPCWPRSHRSAPARDAGARFRPAGAAAPAGLSCALRAPGLGAASPVMTGSGSVCGSSSAGRLLAGRARVLAAGLLPAGPAPALADRSQSILASCHAAADCCHTEAGSTGAG